VFPWQSEDPVVLVGPEQSLRCNVQAPAPDPATDWAQFQIGLFSRRACSTVCGPLRFLKKTR